MLCILYFIPYASYFVLPLFLYYINRVISQRNTTVVLAVHPDIFLAETLQASARPDSLSVPVTPVCLRCCNTSSGVPNGRETIFFGIKNLEAEDSKAFSSSSEKYSSPCPVRVCISCIFLLPKVLNARMPPSDRKRWQRVKNRSVSANHCRVEQDVIRSVPCGKSRALHHTAKS